MIAAAEGRARAYLKAELTMFKAEHREAAAVFDEIQADALTGTTIAELRRHGDELQDAAKVRWAAMCDQLVRDFRFACTRATHPKLAWWRSRGHAALSGEECLKALASLDLTT